MKKIPLRTCCVTREKCEKRDLIRIVRMPSGEVKVDLTGKLNGRGALDRHLEVSVPDTIYEELVSIVENR